jgi:hypothetical protein
MPNAMIERPTKKGIFREPLGPEFDNIYGFLSKLFTGSFRFYYHKDDGKLYLQDMLNGQWTSVATIDHDGNIEATGTITGSCTLKNPGRG